MTKTDKNNNEVKPANVLEMYPTQNVVWETLEDQNIALLVPKFKNKFLVKYLVPKMKNPNLKIKLDKFGTRVWQYIDGKNSVMQIGNHLKEDYGQDVEPVYERLGLFINLLAQRNFITLTSDQQ